MKNRYEGVINAFSVRSSDKVETWSISDQIIAINVIIRGLWYLQENSEAINLDAELAAALKAHLQGLAFYNAEFLNGVWIYLENSPYDLMNKKVFEFVCEIVACEMPVYDERLKAIKEKLYPKTAPHADAEPEAGVVPATVIKVLDGELEQSEEPQESEAHDDQSEGSEELPAVDSTRIHNNSFFQRNKKIIIGFTAALALAASITAIVLTLAFPHIALPIAVFFHLVAKGATALGFTAKFITLPGIFSAIGTALGFSVGTGVSAVKECVQHKNKQKEGGDLGDLNVIPVSGTESGYSSESAAEPSPQASPQASPRLVRVGTGEPTNITGKVENLVGRVSQIGLLRRSVDGGSNSADSSPKVSPRPGCSSDSDD